MSILAPLRRGFALVALTISSACSGDAAPAGFWRVLVVDGLDQPESVQYDSEQDVFFVSSMAGLGSDKNGAGYISRFPATEPERLEVFVRGGENGVTLHSPKGMAIQGPILWVADIDVLRGFDRRTGAAVRELDLSDRGAVLLNAVTVGPDGTVYVTDSGIVMSDIGILYTGGDKIFAIRPEGAVAVIAEGPELGHPNGITWDPEENRLIVVSFDQFDSEAYSLGPDGRGRTLIAKGPGRFDGVQLLEDRRLLITSWSDSSLYVVRDGEVERAIRDLWQPADHGIDTRRRRVAIPLVLPGRVEVWQLPPL